MNKRLALGTIVFLMAPSLASAQGSPVAAAFTESAASFGKNLVAAAEVMPADKYRFKPTPAQMSFGAIVTHLIEGNDYLCGGSTKTRAAVETLTTGDWADHYSQMAIYLRLNGHLPPTAKK